MFLFDIDIDEEQLHISYLFILFWIRNKFH